MPSKGLTKRVDWRRYRYLIFLLPLAVHLLISLGKIDSAQVLLYLSLLIALKVTLDIPTAAFAGLSVLTGMMVGGSLLWLEGARLTIFFPAILIPLFFSVSFVSSLLPGRTPLITGIALAVRGSLPPRMMRYTRQITAVWGVFCLLLSVEALALSLWAPLTLWSLFTNILNYVLIVLFFMLEYLFRKWVVKEDDILSFLETLRVVPKAALARRDR